MIPGTSAESVFWRIFFPYRYSNNKERKNGQLQTVLKILRFTLARKNLYWSCPHFSITISSLFFFPSLPNFPLKDLSLFRNKHYFPIERRHHQNHTKRASSTWFTVESGPGASASLPNYSKGIETPGVHYLFCHLENMDNLQLASLETMPVSPVIEERWQQCSMCLIVTCKNIQGHRHNSIF